MKNLMTTTALVCALALTGANNAEAAMKQTVTFPGQNQILAGDLYLPDNYQQGDKLPGVVITGAWTTVKEQMPATYANELADRGYAALVFDFRGWGASQGDIKFLEDPMRKTADINAAVDYLVTRPEVVSDKVAGLGICASAGYMSDAAAANPNIKSLALVAPWLHDADIVDAVYGGKDSVASLISAAVQAKDAASPIYLEAASMTNEKAVMHQVPYYTEKDRGLIPEYDNKFNVASWQGWLTYDALKTAEMQTKPTLLIHSEAAAIPQGTKQYAQRGGDNVQLVMLKNATQFDFYDKPDVVNTASNAVAEHFNLTFADVHVNQSAIDEASIKTIVESVGTLADSHNFEALEKLYADEITLDYTSLAGGEVELKSPQSLMTQWASVLPGFDRTRHAISNIVVKISGNKASATAHVTADHYVNALYWQVTGDYLYRLEKGTDGWQITSHTFNLKDETGTREVFGPAMENAATNPVAYLLRYKTQQAVTDFLSALEEKDMEKFASVWADDAVQMMPYAPDGFPEQVAGRGNIIKLYAAWPDTSGAADFTSQLVFYPMQDPEMVFAEFKGDVDIIPTGRNYKQHYGGLFHVENGKIKLFREYFNPVPFKWAFGM